MVTMAVAVCGIKMRLLRIESPYFVAGAVAVAVGVGVSYT